MPLVRISLRRGKGTTHLQALRDGVYAALRDTFEVPESDRFILVHQHDDDAFDCSSDYLGITRSQDLVIIQITCSNTRTSDQKQALYQQLTRNLSASPGLRPEDVFINLLETDPHNWSFGNGGMQYA
ncbi:tautomerase family protein [Salinicola endophyticus]|uniref:Tautomerase family protein n=1 Tax=Salinicola endophyticus TaxID=1949083 RepID=A0ABY8FGZ9_9GAMM|nr:MULTISPECIES: tautomerase family protein [Salinicola]WFF42076.1 tautomerase family protein [Salinicola endophyticus]